MTASAWFTTLKWKIIKLSSSSSTISMATITTNNKKGKRNGIVGNVAAIFDDVTVPIFWFRLHCESPFAFAFRIFDLGLDSYTSYHIHTHTLTQPMICYSENAIEQFKPIMHSVSCKSTHLHIVPSAWFIQNIFPPCGLFACIVYINSSTAHVFSISF